jgi:hypothetical protein
MNMPSLVVIFSEVCLDLRVLSLCHFQGPTDHSFEMLCLSIGMLAKLRSITLSGVKHKMGDKLLTAVH